MESSLPSSQGRGLSQGPGPALILPVYLAEAPLPAHPQSHSCPQHWGDLILPGTSCTCFFCILCRQEMGMRWKVKEGQRKVSLSLLLPSFRARWCLPSHWRPKSSGCRGGGRGRLTRKGESLWGPTPEVEGEKGWRVCRSGFWQTLRTPLPPHFPSAPLLSSLKQYTSCFYPCLLWCLCWWASPCVLRGRHTNVIQSPASSCSLLPRLPLL